MLANHGANLVSIAVPPIWRKLVSLNLKLFGDRINHSNSAKERLLGFLARPLCSLLSGFYSLTVGEVSV